MIKSKQIYLTNNDSENSCNQWQKQILYLWNGWGLQQDIDLIKKRLKAVEKRELEKKRQQEQ